MLARNWRLPKGGEAPAGPPIAYVRQKKLAIREDIRFYADEQETRELFRKAFADGLRVVAPLIAQAAMLLKPSGILVLELGYNSAEYVSRLLNASGWSDVAITNDLAGIRRVASAPRA